MRALFGSSLVLDTQTHILQSIRAIIRRKKQLQQKLSTPTGNTQNMRQQFNCWYALACFVRNTSTDRKINCGVEFCYYSYNGKQTFLIEASNLCRHRRRRRFLPSYKCASHPYHLNCDETCNQPSSSFCASNVVRSVVVAIPQFPSTSFRRRCCCRWSCLRNAHIFLGSSTCSTGRAYKSRVRSDALVCIVHSIRRTHGKPFDGCGIDVRLFANAFAIPK